MSSNLSDGADLAGSAVSIADSDDNKLLVLDIHRPAERYVRAVVTRGTADATIDGVIAILYGPRAPAGQSGFDRGRDRDARLTGRRDGVMFGCAYRPELSPGPASTLTNQLRFETPTESCH